MMISKLRTTIRAHSFLLWEYLGLAISILCFILILLNRSPNFLRPLSLALRTGFGLVIPAAAILVYVAFRIPGRMGTLSGMTLTMSLFAMPLAGLWASGQAQSTVLSGLIPLYDAELYYVDALGLLNGSRFSIFSARRPLFPSLLAVLLSWTGYNLMATLAILTGIVGLACYFAAREIQRTHGAEMSTFILIILFLFFRAHSGVSMSENLGTALGVLGFCLLWQGAARRSASFVCLGLFTTTFALNARAGAFFMLPLLILWAGWLFRKNKFFSWKFAALATFSVVLSFALNLFLTRLIATPSGVPFANFSYTLYGLASGGESWVHVFHRHPELANIDEPEKTKQIYQLAFELIRTHPMQMVQGALFNWKMLFSDSWYSIYSYVGGENWLIMRYAQWAMYLLSLTGIYAWFQERQDPIKSLIMISFIGVFISVPFLPPTDAYRMRPYAASIIILAALPALGLHFILRAAKLQFPAHPDGAMPPVSAAPIFSSILIFITTAGPLALRSASTPVSLQATACENGSAEYVLVRFDEGTYINIKRESLSFLDWMPDFHTGQFRKNAHSLADNNLIKWAESLEPPTTLFLTRDFHTDQKVLVALKAVTPPTSGKYYQFCGNFETNPSLSWYRIFYTDETVPLSP